MDSMTPWRRHGRKRFSWQVTAGESWAGTPAFMGQGNSFATPAAERRSKQVPQRHGVYQTINLNCIRP